MILTSKFSRKYAKDGKDDASTEKAFLFEESIRALKATISVSIPKPEEDGGVAVLATSSYPGEGKTTVAVNLALKFATEEKKTVLIDADLRKGTASTLISAFGKKGLTDYLSGQATLEEILCPSERNPHLFVISCGSKTPKPYELIESKGMQELLKTLKKQFAFVLLDTPPVQVVPDALAVAPFVDGSFVVCRHQTTYEHDLKSTVNKLKYFKSNVLGIVVNAFEEEGKGYGVYKKGKNKDRYGYAYGYGDKNDKNP